MKTYVLCLYITCTLQFALTSPTNSSTACQLGEMKLEDCSECTCMEISKDRNEWTCKELDQCHLDVHKRTKRSPDVVCCVGDSTTEQGGRECTCVHVSGRRIDWVCDNK